MRVKNGFKDERLCPGSSSRVANRIQGVSGARGVPTDSLLGPRAYLKV